MTEISMTPTDYHAITDAHDHIRRAVSAVQAAEPFDSSAMVVLDHIRKRLTGCLQQLEALKRDAQVTP